MSKEKEDLEEEGAEVVDIASHPEYVRGPKPEPHDIEEIRRFVDEAFANVEEVKPKGENREKLFEEARRQGDADEWCRRMRRRLLEFLRGDE